MFTTPRPVPARKGPFLAGTLVVLLALPVAVAAGAPLAGWGLAAVLWAAGAAFAYVLGRLPLGADNLAASGMRGIGMTFRGIGIMVVLIAVTVADQALGVTAALIYIGAYSVELAASLVLYFSGSRAA
jgi:hypothetical protein